MPVRPFVQPRVEGHELLAANALQAPHDFREQAHRRREQIASQAIRLGV